MAEEPKAVGAEEVRDAGLLVALLAEVAEGDMICRSDLGDEAEAVILHHIELVGLLLRDRPGLCAVQQGWGTNSPVHHHLDRNVDLALSPSLVELLKRCLGSVAAPLELGIETAIGGEGAAKVDEGILIRDVAVRKADGSGVGAH